MVCVNKYIAGRTKIEYYEDNKANILKQKKEYYEENLDKILEQHNKPFECECGGKYTHCHKPRHLRTIKHCQYIASLQ